MRQNLSYIPGSRGQVTKAGVLTEGLTRRYKNIAAEKQTRRVSPRCFTVNLICGPALKQRQEHHLTRSRCYGKFLFVLRDWRSWQCGWKRRGCCALKARWWRTQWSLLKTPASGSIMTKISNRHFCFNGYIKDVPCSLKGLWVSATLHTESMEWLHLNVKQLCPNFKSVL